MPGPTTQFNPSSLYGREGLRNVVRLERDTKPKNLVSLFATQTTKQIYESIAALSRLGYPTQRAEGENVTFDEIKHIGSLNVYVVGYATGFSVTEEAEAADFYKVLGQKAQKLNVGRAFADLEEWLAVDKFNNHTATTAHAFNTRGYVGVDGVALVSHSHPTLSGTNWSNRGDGTNDLAFSNLNIETAMSQMKAGRTYRDILMEQEGPFALVVPRQLAMAARRYTNSQLLPQSANNDKNINVTSGITRVIESNKLTSATAWWLVSDSAADRDLNLLRRIDMRTKIVDNINFQTDVAVMSELATYHAEAFGVWGTTGA